MNYADGILQGFTYCLESDPRVIVIGQGLWSPWYVGSTMRDLEITFGKHRVIDTPVSEQATTGVGVGAALCGYKPVVTHPRVDFALLALDQMVNQAAKWSSMFGGNVPVPVTFRLIINRGGEQGAQHSQSLFSWFAHIPGLRVVTPGTARDARDLLIAATLSADPVVYMDDRWLYEVEDDVDEAGPVDLRTIRPQVLRPGADVTIVGFGWGTELARRAADRLQSLHGVDAEVIDLRTINPLHPEGVIASVRKTGRLVVVDPDWRSCGVGAEIVATVVEELMPGELRARPRRVTLADAPAPTSKPLEAIYYPTPDDVVAAVHGLLDVNA